MVKKSDEAKLFKSLSNQILTDPHSLPKIELHGDHYLGEYPWHPEVIEFGKWTQPGSWPEMVVPTRATVADYMCERGGYDYSIDQTICITLPAPWLAKALEIRLSNGRQLNYVDSTDRVIFCDPSVSEEGPQAALVDRDVFLAMLKREQLAALWVIAGEKSVYGGHDPNRGFGGRVLHSGVYRMRGDDFDGHIHWAREHPTKDQIENLFEGESVPPGITIRTDSGRRGRARKKRKQ